MTIDVDESHALQDFRRGLFGHAGPGETIPTAYLAQLKNLVKSADATLGVRDSTTERRAFWVEGCVLGYLASTGLEDSNAEITGWLIRLDDVTKLEIDVETAPGDWDDSSWVSGRILEINADTVLDASPGKFSPAKLDEIERFIDEVLAADAGRKLN